MLRYSVLLVRSGLRKADLAVALGVTRSAVSRWSDEKVPGYAVAYLALFIELQRYRP